jgi:hypothetical protein
LALRYFLKGLGTASLQSPELSQTLIIRRFLETRYTDRPVIGPTQCILLSDEERSTLRTLGKQVHVRGVVTRMTGSQRCPNGRRARGGIDYVEALRPEKLEPFQVMTCDPELYVVTEGRCRP